MGAACRFGVPRRTPVPGAGLLVCLVVALTTVHASGQIIDRVLASVGGRIVTASDVRMAREFGLVRADEAADPQVVLRRLVDRILVLDEVDRYAPPEPADPAVRTRLDEIRARFESAESFASAMRTAGVDEASLMQWVRDDLRIRAYLDQRFAGVVEPTATELENYVLQIQADAAKSGRTLPPDDIQRLAREEAISERRQALIREWIDGLRKRASVTYSSEF